MTTNKPKEKRKFILTVLAISIIAVLLVPMLYSSIYLGSVWDVYGKIHNVPVAFVNQDKAVTKDGKEYAIGRELEKNLRDSEKVAWKFVNHEEAIKGVEGTDYYAIIEIPADFSQKIADTQDGNFENPEVIYISNKGKNYVFSQVSSKVADSIKTEISSGIQKEITKALVDSLYDVKVSIKDAGDGADKLQSGTQKLLDGSRELAEGTQKAADGSIKLENGLKLAAESSVKLQEGTQKLVKGSIDLSTGLNTASKGSKELLDGLKSITNGESTVVSGSTTLIDGLNTFKNNLTKPNDEMPLLVKGASDLNTNTGVISQGAEKLDTSISTLAAAVNAADGYLNDANLTDAQKLNAAKLVLDQISRQAVGPNGESQLTLASNSIRQLSLGLQQLKTGTEQVSEGVTTLSSGLKASQTTAAEGLDQLIDGVEQIKNGSGTILTGLKTASEKTEVLATGLTQLNTGSTSLQEGLRVVNNGNLSLKDGLSNAAAKTGELSKGLKTLNSGSTALQDGLQDANGGSIKLRDGLIDGYTEMDNNLKFNSENMSQFVSAPVILKDNSINNVEYYGKGLAPYFISLSLWLGAMFMSMIFSIAKTQKLFKSKYMNSFIGKYLAGSGLVTLQALILSFTLIKVLDVNPASISGFYFNNIFISIAFFSVMYWVSHVIGILSAPVMFIVLLLQLASSGGTFPIETAPAFYRVIGKVLPMTYSVSTLRMTLTGLNTSVLNENILIMLIFTISFICGGTILKAFINFVRSKNSIVEKSKVI